MRLGILAPLALAVMTPVAAEAAVIVQRTSDGEQRPVWLFSNEFGSLDRVTLAIDVRKTRDWIVTPAPGVQSDTITWAIDDLYEVRVQGIERLIPLRGAGSTVVDFSRPISSRDGTNLVLEATAAETIDLDPAAFVAIPGQFDQFVIVGNDQGHSAPGNTVISSAARSGLRRSLGTCYGLRFNEDICGSALFTLTYSYTPAGSTPGVPEPATWAMMLFGFGAVGGGLRRRRRAFNARHAPGLRACCRIRRSRPE